MLPPKQKGVITFIAPAANYVLEACDYLVHCNPKDVVLEIEYENEKKCFTMIQTWPIRVQRPFLEKLECDRPTTLGIRIYDALFPTPKGT